MTTSHLLTKVLSRESSFLQKSILFIRPTCITIRTCSWVSIFPVRAPPARTFPCQAPLGLDLSLCKDRYPTMADGRRRKRLASHRGQKRCNLVWIGPPNWNRYGSQNETCGSNKAYLMTCSSVNPTPPFTAFMLCSCSSLHYPLTWGDDFFEGVSHPPWIYIHKESGLVIESWCYKYTKSLEINSH